MIAVKWRPKLRLYAGACPEGAMSASAHAAPRSPLFIRLRNYTGRAYRDVVPKQSSDLRPMTNQIRPTQS
jgi:hypothetical protein